MSPRVKKIAKWTLLGLAGAFLVIQIFRPDRSNPAVDPAHTLAAVSNPPADVSAVLERSCFDCHSNQTHWPWYTNVAPVSWFVADHVHDGRRALNFSEFASYPVRKQAHALKEACEQVEEGEMPLSTYTLIHRGAKMSDADKKLVCDWAKQESGRLRATMPPGQGGGRGGEGGGRGGEGGDGSRPTTGDGSGTGHGTGGGTGGGSGGGGHGDDD